MPRAGRVVEGYGILQPRVTPARCPRLGRLALPARLLRRRPASTRMPPRSRTSTRICSAKAPYAGKGIYDVDAFEAALARPRAGERPAQPRPVRRHLRTRRPRRPTSRWSKNFRRATTSPRAPASLGARRLAAPALDPRAARRERRRGAVGRLPLIGRWKMLDNLRRTLSAPASVAALLAGWTLPLHAALLVDRIRAGDARACRRCCRCSRRRAAALAVIAAQPPARAARSTWLSRSRRPRCSSRILAHQAWLMVDAIVPHPVAPVREPPAPARMDHRGRRPSSRSDLRRLLPPHGAAAWSSRWRRGAGDVFAAAS